MNYFILLLGGEGIRTKNKTPKQFLKINNKEIFIYPLEEILKNKKINEIILVVNKKYLNHVNKIISEKFYKENIYIVDAGKTRQQSVFNALNFIKTENKNTKNIKVIIHDSARPLLNNKKINLEINKLNDVNAITTYLKIYESVAHSNDMKIINNYLNRNEIILIQTPQAFKFDIIYKAHKKALQNNLFNFKDDCSMIKELLNKKIYLIEGDYLSSKITINEDLILFNKLLK